jgi:AcrR family transcriptional regulator
MNQSPWQPISPEKPARATREPLTRERIVDAALRILLDQGYDAVSMRKVAQALGTGPASLYAHVANKAELDQLLVDRVAANVVVPKPDPARWREQVKEVLRSSLNAMRANPGVARAAIGQVPMGERALDSTEGLLAILKAGRVPDQAAAWAIDMFMLYVTAVSFEEYVQGAGGWTEDEVVTFVDGMRTFLQGLPTDRYPITVALAGPLTAGANPDERFEFGLEILVGGLAAMVPPE